MPGSEFFFAWLVPYSNAIDIKIEISRTPNWTMPNYLIYSILIQLKIPLEGLVRGAFLLEEKDSGLDLRVGNSLHEVVLCELQKRFSAEAYSGHVYPLNNVVSRIKLNTSAPPEFCQSVSLPFLPSTPHLLIYFVLAKPILSTPSFIIHPNHI